MVEWQESIGIDSINTYVHVNVAVFVRLSINRKADRDTGVPNPRAAFAYLDIWAVIADTYGPAFMQQIRAQNPRMVNAGAAGIQALEAGEGSVLFPTTGGNIMDVRGKGAPVDMVVPEKTTGVEMQVMLTHRSKTKRSAAARLLANYLISLDGNKALNDEPGGITIYDAKGLPRQ